MGGEKAMLEWLQKHPSDFCGAYSRINKMTRLICAHAYQSYLWNMAVSERIRLYGFECVEGDLVAVSDIDELIDNSQLEDFNGFDDGQAAVIESESNEKSKTMKATIIEGEFNESTGEESKSLPNSTTTELSNLSNSSSALHAVHSGKVRLLTKEDVASGSFAFDQVVLPIPGFDVMLPSHAIGAYYHSLLESDGLDLSSFRHVLPEYRMAGHYRRVTQRPQDFDWSLLRYPDAEANCELTDTELNPLRSASVKPVVFSMSSSQLQSIVKESEPTTNARVTDDDTVLEVGNVSDGCRKAVHLKFTLSAGTYATMMLRELTKESTETKYHSSLTAISGGRRIDDASSSICVSSSLTSSCTAGAATTHQLNKAMEQENKSIERMTSTRCLPEVLDNGNLAKRVKISSETNEA